MCAFRVEHSHMVGLRNIQFRCVLDRNYSFGSGMCLISAFESVVFADPVAPEIMMFFLAITALPENPETAGAVGPPAPDRGVEVCSSTAGLRKTPSPEILQREGYRGRLSDGDADRVPVVAGGITIWIRSSPGSVADRWACLVDGLMGEARHGPRKPHQLFEGKSGSSWVRQPPAPSVSTSPGRLTMTS